MGKIATHGGTVTAADNGTVTVKMRVESACSSCEAHAHCGFAEGKEKEMLIDTPDWQSYRPGDRVSVTIDSGLGLKAVLLAYVLPAVVLLAVFVVLSCLRLPEVAVAVASLLAVAIYGGILYLRRDTLQHRFTFKISRQE